MHEISIATAIVEELEEVAAESGYAHVYAVRLQVGELSCVVNEALRFAWDLATEGTIVFGARLDIERIPVSLECSACGRIGEPPSKHHFICAACGSPSTTIVRGRELLVAAMEVDDADAGRGDRAFDPQKELDAGVRPA
jgi:hydrogenase nickel incorporation protein HypA/HybF